MIDLLSSFWAGFLTGFTITTAIFTLVLLKIDKHNKRLYRTMMREAGNKTGG